MAEVAIASSVVSSAGALALAIVRNNPGCLTSIVKCGKVHKLRGVLIPSKCGKTTLINSLNSTSSRFHFVDVESESKVFLQNSVGPVMMELKQKQDWSSMKNLLLQHVPQWVEKLKPLKGKKLVLVASSMDLLETCGCNVIWALCPSQKLVKEQVQKLPEQDRAEMESSVHELYRACDQSKVLVYDSYLELANLFKALFNVQLKF